MFSFSVVFFFFLVTCSLLSTAFFQDYVKLFVEGFTEER